MENFVKLQSVQGLFDTTGSKNLCDFQIPANSGSYNLAESFLNVNVKITNTDTPVADATGVGTGTGADSPAAVYNQGLVINESTREGNAFQTLINPENAVLVKNARMVCARGKVEDIRRVDCLRSNLAVYKQSTENTMRNTFGLSNGSYYDIMPVQPFNALVGEGSQESETRNHDIRIPLSSIFEMGKSEVWDTSYYGHTKMNLELNLDKLSILNKTTQALANNRYLLRGATENYTAMKDIANGSAGNVAIGSDDYALVSKVVYESLEDAPFYVGQRCSLDVQTGTGAFVGTPKIVQIKSIELADATTKQPNDAGGTTDHKNSLVITLTCTYGTIANGQNLGTITLTPIAPAGSSIQVNNIELVAKMSDEQEDQPTQYTTYVAQEDTAPAGDNINRTYTLPPNTTNCYVMFNNPIYSHEDLDTYRITLDGVDLTNRDVKVKSGLHYDIISSVFMNRGQAVGSVEERMYDGDKRFDEAGESQSIVVVMFPVKLKNSNTQLGLELNGTALSGKIIVYSEVVKEL